MLELKNICKSYPQHRQGQHRAVDDVSFALPAGSISALVGPSGCGKTTTLRVVAGFETPDDGTVTLEGRTLFGPGTNVPPEQRGLGFVFQDYALFPHLTVLGNTAFGLSHLPPKERLAQARQMLALVGLTVFEQRYPHQLSGGQQQRVALARALAPKPKLILLDEPFSSLDTGLRESTRQEVRGILQTLGASALLVTHDQEEALSFADHVLVMRNGRLEQAGAPQDMYLQPRTAFVAGFLGRTNLLPAKREHSAAITPFGKLELGLTGGAGSVMLSIRPEDLCLDTGGVPATVRQREYKGHDMTLTLELDNGVVLAVQTDHRCTLHIGERTGVRLQGQAVVVR